ncbi:MAG: hypothetical protein JKY51_04985, partial [Opitutaceae bacterium]|nr:hypothetical protein [Opitutaceae bacterium]
MQYLSIFTFLLSMSLFFPAGAHAEQRFIGKKHTIAGVDTSGLCQLINNTSCYSESTDISALSSILSGEVDLASVPTSSITPDINVRVLMHLDTDKSTILISREGFPEDDALAVINTIQDFLLSGKEKTQSKLIQELVKLPRIYGSKNALGPYLEFNETYKL